MKNKVDEIIYGNDFIIDVYNYNSIVKFQGDNLLEHLQDWQKILISPHQGLHRNVSVLFSPVFDSNNDLKKTIDDVYNALDILIRSLNNQNKTISRVSLCIYESDDIESITPIQSEKGLIFGKEGKRWEKDWIFDQNSVFKDFNHIFGNRFNREYSKFKKVKNKYYILKLDSSYLSI